MQAKTSTIPPFLFLQNPITDEIVGYITWDWLHARWTISELEACSVFVTHQSDVDGVNRFVI